MISARLIHIIEGHQEEITNRILHAVQHHPELARIGKLPEKELRAPCRPILKHLGSWLVDGMENELTKGYDAHAESAQAERAAWTTPGVCRVEKHVSIRELPSVAAVSATEEHLRDMASTARFLIMELLVQACRPRVCCRSSRYLFNLFINILWCLLEEFSSEGPVFYGLTQKRIEGIPALPVKILKEGQAFC